MIFECYQEGDADKIARDVSFRELIFARQMFVTGELLKDLPPEDRITPIVGMLKGAVEKAGELRVEVADTNESKELLKFCRKFTVPLRNHLRNEKILLKVENFSRPVVHVFLLRRDVVMLAIPIVLIIPILYGYSSIKIPIRCAKSFDIKT